MKSDLQQIKDKIVPILKEAGVTRSALFGSYVRGGLGYLLLWHYKENLRVH
jgi:predicted nucleotidyltransferase